MTGNIDMKLNLMRNELTTLENKISTPNSITDNEAPSL